MTPMRACSCDWKVSYSELRRSVSWGRWLYSEEHLGRTSFIHSFNQFQTAGTLL